MGKILITTGLCIIAVGLMIHFFGDKMGWFGNLFGDIKIDYNGLEGSVT